MSARSAPRLLVLGAGTSAGNNLIRSLRAGDPSLAIAAAHHDRFVLAAAPVAPRYLVPPPDDPDFGEAIARMLRIDGADLVLPTSDAGVARLAALRGSLPARLFLPSAATLALCADKVALARHLAASGVAVPRTIAVEDGVSVAAALAGVALDGRAWCRVRRGSGSTGAAPVESAEQAEAWIRYWEEMRDVPPGSFMLAEYLPGRDIACQSLWKEGTLVLVKTFERLAYISVGGNPSGVSSAASLAKTVVDSEAAEVGVGAVRAVDPRATGVFGVDLKGSAAGRPCVTEINAGRFLAGTPLLDLTGRHNMAVTYVRLARGEPVDVPEPYDTAEPPSYMVRSVDTEPLILPEEEFFERVRDARE